MGAIAVQGIAANITNVYTGGLSLVNTVPRSGASGRPSSSRCGRGPGRFPDFVHHAQGWITHLGNVAAPLTGVVLADYLVTRRGRVDVDALFDPRAATGS